MSITDNIILLTDSYKVSHSLQYPKGTTEVYSYLESRGGEFEETVFFGLNYLLKTYLEKPITRSNIEEAADFYKKHFGSDKLFNREGWEYILNEHNGKLPVSIKAVAEGTVVSTKNVLMTVVNTDPKCFWLTNYLETLLSQVWYPCTVATLSREQKKQIKASLEKSADSSDGLMFKLHDFGFRGVETVESAGIGGAAHLVNFMGTDTVAGLMVAKEYYGCEMAGFSIPASEHSTITSWGKENEVKAFENMLDSYPTGLVACVSDSFNIYDACDKLWGTQLKDKILTRDGVLVIRPDSGEATEVLPKILNILGERLGFTTNSKGYRVLPPQVRIIQGDGIDLETLPKILNAIMASGWSTDNLAFGSGGGLLQKVNRDTAKFAFKCSSVTINGEDREVYKQPIDMPWKMSKKGKMKLVVEKGWKDRDIRNERLITVGINDSREDQLVEVYRNGEILVNPSFDGIRKRAEIK
jgi:nicotinamide phosphoribosyltransferase